MKILSLSNCPLVESQGSGYVALNFIRGLRALGHEVDAFGPEDFEWLPWLRRGKNWRLAFGLAWCAFRKLREKNYAVVEFYGGHAWLAAAVLNLIPNRRFLMVNHSNGLEPYCEEVKAQFLGESRHQPAPVHWAYSKVDAIVTVSEDERRFVLRAKLQDAGHVVAFENALPDTFLNLPVESHRPPVILYCGSWLPRKGVAMLKAAMPEMLREFPEYQFRLVGVGQAFRKQDHFPPDVCDRIEVVPFVSDKLELRRQYQSARIVVVPSIYESFGLVTAEAMACGCAVVTTDIGFGADLKSGVEAVVISGRSSPVLCQALKTLLPNGARRFAIARRGHARVQRLQWKPAIAGLERAYTGWLRERQELTDAPALVQAR
ncbi:MAG: glycosyltransferase family 4 protein [Akkermansiaceae bacterium]|nr:glycosyltransferase family 4 protein [Verrucomicrobiales bacterium]